MSENLLVNGEALEASLKGMLAAEQFLNDNYLFRRNVLSGKVEFAEKTAVGTEDGTTVEDQEPAFRPLTELALNSIVLRAKREDICEGKSPKTDIEEYINSEEVPAFDPINDYLSHLPQWDGQNHVAQLFNRIPGISSEQLTYLNVSSMKII